MRRIARVTQAEISRATKVAKAQGMAVEISPDGTIRLFPTVPLSNPAVTEIEPVRRIVL